MEYVDICFNDEETCTRKQRRSLIRSFRKHKRFYQPGLIVYNKEQKFIRIIMPKIHMTDYELDCYKEMGYNIDVESTVKAWWKNLILYIAMHPFIIHILMGIMMNFTEDGRKTKKQGVKAYPFFI